MEPPSPGVDGHQRRDPEVLVRPDERQNRFRNILDLQRNLDLLLEGSGRKVDLQEELEPLNSAK